MHNFPFRYITSYPLSSHDLSFKMADEGGDAVESCQNGFAQDSMEVNSHQESYVVINSMYCSESYKAANPNDSTDSSDYPLPSMDIPDLQGTPKTILSHRFRKRRKQLRPNKSLSLPTDSAEASQSSTPVSSPPHPMDEQSKAPETVILEEKEDEDTCMETSESEPPDNAVPSKDAVEETSASPTKKKPKKSEVEILFSSMTTTDMAALYVRNRTEADSWYSPRKASASTPSSFAGIPIPVTPTRTAAAVSKVINEVNLTRVPRSKAKQTVSKPTISLPQVTATTAALRQRRPRPAATTAGPSGTQNCPKQTEENKKAQVPAAQTCGDESVALATSSLSSVDDGPGASSSKPTGTTGHPSMSSQQPEIVSTRHLPSAKSFKATFSFEEMFCKYSPAIVLKDGELVPVHSMAVPLHARVPQDHYLRRWKINRRRPADSNGSSSSSQAHKT